MKKNKLFDNSLVLALLLMSNLCLSQSITLSPTNLNGRQGIGIETPGTTLEVASTSSGNGINISGLGNGFRSARLSFWSDRLTANEWRPAYIQSSDNGSFTGRLDFYTNGTSSGNKIGNVRGMSLVNGSLGIGTSNPKEKLHIANGNIEFSGDSPLIRYETTTNINQVGLTFGRDNSFLSYGHFLVTPLDFNKSIISISASPSSSFPNNGVVITTPISTTGHRMGINEDEPEATLHLRTNTQPTLPHLRFYENNNLESNAIVFENFVGFSDEAKTWSLKYKTVEVPESLASYLKFNVEGFGDVLNMDGTGNVTHHGYTRLGDEITTPKVKMQKLTGTTAASQGGTATMVHGLNSDKILAVDIAVEYANGNYVPEKFTAIANREFEYYYTNREFVIINKIGNSSAILSDSIKILVTYEE